MQIKTFVLVALSATAAVAGPHHRRQHHPHYRGSGRGGSRSTSVRFPAGNATDVNPTGTRGTGSRSRTAIATTFGNVASSVVDPVDGTSSCTSTSTATETSVQLVTVTGAGASKADPTFESTASVSAGEFYGSRTWGGRPGQSSAAGGASTAPAGGAPTSFMTQPSASKTAGSSASAVPSSGSGSGNSTGPAPGVSGTKRGISFNDAGKVSAFGGSVSWAYNWGKSESGSLGGVEFVPMLWGLNDVSSFSAGNAKSVLSFNEPDLSSQANIDPVTAASKHKQVFSSMKGKVNIGSPAITNGNSQGPNYMGIPWLNKFFESCGSDCPVDFIAFHWYAGANNIDYFKQHVNDVVAAASAHGISRVWLTEFAPDSGSDTEKANFFQQAVKFLEGVSAVERYAGFMASDGTLMSGGSLNAAGKAYSA